MGGGGGGGGNTRELDQTPTWAVSSVCAVIVLISILLEKGLHSIGEWFRHRKKKAMFEALEKVKTELMVLGFISLLLVFGQNYIIKICITDQAADTMLPCRLSPQTVAAEQGQEHHPAADPAAGEHPAAGGGGEQPADGGGGEHPAGGGGEPEVPKTTEHLGLSHRMLMEASSATKCPDGKVSLISINGLHQLHIFIFFLAAFHVIYSAITMALGRAKIRGWKEWERDTSTQNYEFSNDPSRFRFTHETSFVRQHMNSWTRTPVSFYVVSFFRQFFRSVRRADYLAMRHGFVNVHLAPGSKFDFQKYIKRSLEDDFKVVVGISPILWASALIFLLLNVQGWHTMLYISIMPMIIILSVGTKLQGIITRMAIDIKERHAVIQGIPLVQLSDQHFWFGRPKFVLFLIHFTLFQNAFQIIYFVWIWYEFGVESCINDDKSFIIARLCLGVGVQFLCSYVTLPLYALVSQMGSHMKQSIFDEQTSKALMNWRHGVKKKNPKAGGHSPTGRSPGHSPRGSPKASSDAPPAAQAAASGGGGGGGIALTQRRHSSEQEAGAAAPADTAAPASTPNGGGNADLLSGAPQDAARKNGEEDEFAFIKLDP